jgi:mitogen-activated protein kinase 1/3
MDKIDLGSRFADWEVDPEYHIDRLIGKGSYGNVCEATEVKTGKKVAIKKIFRIFEDTIDCKRILREIKLLRLLRQPNVVELIDILEPSDFENFESLYLVMEFAQSEIKKLIKSAIHLQIIHIQT